MDTEASSSRYEVYEGLLDETKSEILRPMLSLIPEGYHERPLNYIRSVRLLDKEGRTLLRGGDRMDFVLFDLPQPKRIELNNAFREHDIPTTVIEQVDIDVNRLEP